MEKKKLLKLAAETELSFSPANEIYTGVMKMHTPKEGALYTLINSPYLLCLLFTFPVAFWAMANGASADEAFPPTPMLLALISVYVTLWVNLADIKYSVLADSIHSDTLRLAVTTLVVIKALRLGADDKVRKVYDSAELQLQCKMIRVWKKDRFTPLNADMSCNL